MILQTPSLMPEPTVLRNICFGLEIHGRMVNEVSQVLKKGGIVDVHSDDGHWINHGVEVDFSVENGVVPIHSLN